MEQKVAVLKLFLAKMSYSTSQAFLVSWLQNVVILSKQEVVPMKVCLLHLVSLHSQLIRGTCLLGTYAGVGRRHTPGTACHGGLQLGNLQVCHQANTNQKAVWFSFVKLLWKQKVYY